MPNVEPSFVLYALLLEPGGCLRAHITLFELVEPEKKKSIHTSHSIYTVLYQTHFLWEGPLKFGCPHCSIQFMC